MSGNPFGLSEISHYGSMQRVGGKAAGFINKKFFHPSSLANQEKLWLAISKQDKLDREEKDAECRREEERQVEALKKQMYQRGQAPGAGDSLFLSSASGIASELDSKQKREQRLAFDEQKKRRGMLVEPASSSSSSAQDASVSSVQLAQSRYPEDVHRHGHESVWGSWFSTELSRWGYRCCETTRSRQRCPLAPDEPEVAARDKAARGDRGTKRKRGSGGQGGRPKHAEDRARLAAEQGAADPGNDDGETAGAADAIPAADGDVAATVGGVAVSNGVLCGNTIQATAASDNAAHGA